MTQKIAAFALVVASAWAFGFIKRSEDVAACRICGQIHELLCELRQCVELKLTPLPRFFEDAARSERFDRLGFLRDIGEGEDGDPVCDSFSCLLLRAWEESPEHRLLSRDEQEELAGVFSTLGSDNTSRESLKLAPSIRFFEGAFSRRERENAGKKGVYETVCMLAGAVVAIVLI